MAGLSPAVPSFDQLVDQLFYRIAVADDQGVGIDDFKKYVAEFYAKHQNAIVQAQQDGDVLFSDSPPNPPTVDDALVNRIWRLVIEHEDVEVRSIKSEVKTAADLDISHRPVAHADDSSNDGNDERLFVSNERVWHVLAGHGVDHNRLPPREFSLLRIIAAYGEAGCTQPDLVRLSGQDKRSVPKRTDALATKGYIVKEGVIVNKQRTSLLIGKQYVKHGRLQQTSEENIRTAALFDSWFDGMIEQLKANNNIITTGDLRVGLGIGTDSQKIRRFTTHLRRLAVGTDLVRRVLVPVEGSEGQIIRSLQLMREPTAEDKAVFRADRIKPSTIKDSATRLGGRDEYDDFLDETVTNLQWQPDLPMANIIFDVVDQAGPEGISSSDLAACTIGNQFRRPLDEVMHRLTDRWNTSQPPHLQHLTIVRGTVQVNGNLQLLYRTLGNFEEAVRRGYTTWEVAISELNLPERAPRKSKKTASTSSAVGGAEQVESLFAPAELDQNGFPKIPQTMLARGTMQGMAARRPKKHGRTQAPDITKPEPKKRGRPSKGPPSDALAEVARATPKQDDGGQTSAPGCRELKQLERLRRVADAEYREYRESVERLAPVLVAAQLEKRGARDVGEVDDRPSKIRRLSPPTTDALATRTEIDKMLARTQPGAYINPPGAMVVKILSQSDIGRGRPKKACIIVIKSQRLQNLEWFKEEITSHVRETLESIKIKVEVGGEGEGEEAEAAEAEQPTPAPVLEARPEENPTPPAEVLPSKKRPLPQDSSEAMQPKRRRGRPLKNPILERSARATNVVDVDASPAASSMPQEPISNAKVTTGDGVDTNETVAGSRSPHEVADHDRAKSGVSSNPDECGRRAMWNAATAASASHVLPRMEPDATTDPASATPLAVTVETQPNESVKSESALNGAGPVPKNLSEGLPSVIEVREAQSSHATPSKRGYRAGQGPLIERREILLALLRQAGGVFPGNMELWYPFVTIWEKRHGKRPDRPTVVNMVDRLVRLGELKRFRFSFLEDGKAKSLDVVSEPGIEPTSPQVRSLQTAMIEALPHQYIPPEVELAADFYRPGVRIRHPRQRPGPDDGATVSSSHAVESTHNSPLPAHSRLDTKQSTNAGAWRYASLQGITVKRTGRGQYSIGQTSRPALHQRLGGLRDPETRRRALQTRKRTVAYRPSVLAHSQLVPEAFAEKTIVRLGGLGPAPAARRQLEQTEAPSQRRQPALQGVSSQPVQETSLTRRLELPRSSAAVGTTVSKPSTTRPVAAKSIDPPQTFGKRPVGRPRLYNLARTPSATPAPRVPERASAGASEPRAMKPREVYITKSGAARKQQEVFQEYDRLQAAIMIARLIGGGLDSKHLNWEIVSTALDDRYAVDLLKAKWHYMKITKDAEAVLAREQKDLEERFLEAYANDEMPRIDYLHIGETDWVGMVDWAMDKFKPIKMNQRLVKKKEKTQSTETLEFDLNAYYNDSLTKKAELVLLPSFSAFLSIPLLPEPTFNHRLEVVKTFLRSAAITPHGSYDDSYAYVSRKVESLGLDVYKQAIKELERDKVLARVGKSRDATGRPHRIHASTLEYFKGFSTDGKHGVMLREVATVFVNTLEHFNQQDEMPVAQDVSNAQMLVLQNLHASGHIKPTLQLPPRNDDFAFTGPKLSIWGYQGTDPPGDSRSHTDFEVVYTKTSTYAPNGNLKSSVPVPQWPKPSAEWPDAIDAGVKARPHAFWIDINEDIVPFYWEMCLTSVLHLVVFRPGITAQAISEAHGGRLHDWEATMVLDWLEAVGAVKRWWGGWRTMEYWYCVLSPEVATWKAVEY